MDARINLLGNPISTKFIKHINAASAAVHDSGLPTATQELVKLRQPAGDYQPGMFG
jgi:hypothetical protein